MNIIDCLAIAPYYLTLFLMPPPDLGPPVGEERMEADEPGFGNVGRIMQVLRIRIMSGPGQDHAGSCRCSGSPGS